MTERQQYMKKEMEIHHKKRYFIFEYTSKISNHGILHIKDAKTCSECNKLNSYDKRG